MALVKRTYVDGETIITAQNLNDIQDEIISHANTFVPKTRTINSKALDANITLTASDLSAVPTTRTVNSKALSSNITLTAADVGAVPTTRTVNSKALSSNITLTSDDIGYNSSTTYTSGTVGKAVSDLNGAASDNATAIANTREMIAKVYNAGETATVACKVGELIIYEGYTAQVIAPIAVGDSFVWNTNIKGTTISTELYGWNAKLTGTFTKNNNSDTIDESRFIQKGRICEVHFCITRSSGFTAGSEVTIGNLSVMQRPPVNIRTINGCGAAAYAITGMCYMLFGTNGNIVVTPQINCKTILVDFVYLAD